MKQVLLLYLNQLVANHRLRAASTPALFDVSVFDMMLMVRSKTICWQH